jgi:ADP-ribose pyrophosphatase YjhB (NUDIX family)
VALRDEPPGVLTESEGGATLTLMPAGWMPPVGEISQCLGLCFTDEGQVVLVGFGDGRWSLPGGTVEPEEVLADTLAREVREEACATVVASRYLASQRVVEPPGRPDGLLRHYQSRWWARVRLEPWEPRFETTARRLEPPETLTSAIFWERTGILSLLLAAALDHERRYR